MNIELETAIWLIGIGQLGVLCASALVPLRLDWKHSLTTLPELHRQLYWVYGGYTVMSIIALGATCVACSREIADGGRLALALSVYGTTFWGVRLSLQAVLDARPHLTRWWLWLGYHALTLLFLAFTSVYLAAVWNAIRGLRQ
jgi:hypothetical protein